MYLIVTYLLPFFWIITLSYLLMKWSEKSNLGFSKKFIIGLFFAKCLAGFLYNFVAQKYIPNRGDIWPFYEDGLEMFQAFLQSPNRFFHEYFLSNFITESQLLGTHSNFLRSAFVGIKLFQMLLNFLSGGNLYTNTILFNGIFVFAILKLWKFLASYFTKMRNLSTAALVFFPSVFFYTSSILKDGIVFMLIAFLIPLINEFLFVKKTWKNVLSIFIVSFLLVFMKFFVAGIFFISILLWFFLEKNPTHKWKIIAYVTAGIIVIFFASGFLQNGGIPNYVVQRQQEFFELKAASSIATDTLQPNAESFAQALPGAVQRVLLKPLPGEGGKAMYQVFSYEMILFWFVFIMCFVSYEKKHNIVVQPLVWALVFFAVVNLLLIGYTIPNIGALVRYRSIFLPFLILWMMQFGQKEKRLQKLEIWLMGNIFS